MASWTVLTKDVAGDTPLRAAERVVFVREGVSWLSLPFAPFVLLRHRLWLGFALYLAAAVIVTLAERLLGLPSAVAALMTFGLNLLVALELASLRIRKLLWAGHQEAGVVIAHDLPEAEQRFFAEWTPPAAAVPPSLPPVTARQTPQQPGPVIGSLAEPYPS
ncbi:DUF2628 domain-containing protein [Xanthobacteraceae bacterium A53D]